MSLDQLNVMFNPNNWCSKALISNERIFSMLSIKINVGLKNQEKKQEEEEKRGECLRNLFPQTTVSYWSSVINTESNCSLHPSDMTKVNPDG